MLNRINQLGLTLAIFAFAGLGTAHAQDEDPCGDWEENPCEAGDEEDANPCEAGDDDDDAGAEEAEEAAAPEPTVSGAWPIEIIQRPLTLPASAIGVSGSIVSAKTDAFGLGISGAYGVSEKLTVGAAYGLSLKEFEAKGTLLVNAGFSVMRDDKLEVVAGGSLGYSLLGEALAPLTAGAHGRYRLNDKMAVLFNADFNVFLEEIAMLRPIYLEIGAGFAYQVAPNIHAQLYTQVATIEISDSATGFIGADFLPVTVQGFYSLDNTLDIGAGFFTDLKNEPGESWGLLLSATHYMGI